MFNHLKRISVAFIALALASLFTPPPTPAHAAAIVVNTITDSETIGDGLCSLREAIRNANNDSDSTGGDCEAGLGADTISFSVSGTITLAGSPLPSITSTMTIDATGQAIAISGNSIIRIMDVSAAGHLTLTNLGFGYAFNSATGGAAIANSSGTIFINNSTFSNNQAYNDGGAIYNNGGAVTINNSTFVSNAVTDPTSRGGAIASLGGSLTINGSDFGGNSAVLQGGSIFTTSTTGIVNTTFYDNITANGGAIFSINNDLTINNSTFDDNSALDDGGAIFAFNMNSFNINTSAFVYNTATDEGGAIRASDSPLVINTSAFAGNEAAFGGGIYALNGTLIATNSTFSGNTASSDGGAIRFNFGDIILTHNSFYGNEAGFAGGIYIDGFISTAGNLLAASLNGNCYLLAGTWYDNGYNFSDDNSCSYFDTDPNAALPLSAFDSGVHIPQAGNVAIGAIPYGTVIDNNGVTLACDGSTTDQLDNPRPLVADEACTSGAVEVGSVPPPPVDTLPSLLQVPNVGEILISLAQTQPAYVSAGGEPIYLPNGAPLLLPHDYDGNGFDTYVVTETKSVDGTLWLGIFIGNEIWVWVPSTHVTILR